MNLSPSAIATRHQSSCEGLELEIATVHSLKKARRPWITSKLPDPATVDHFKLWKYSGYRDLQQTSFCLSSCQEDYVHIASIVTECDGTSKRAALYLVPDLGLAQTLKI